MKILLVYPSYPDTFWSFKFALKVIHKKAAFPPLGLLTVAAMLPAAWEKKLVDMNVSPLFDEQIKWADYVFLSAMAVQRDSVKHVIARCNGLNIRVVAGGPLFTTEYEDFTGVEHFILNEAEASLPPFLADLENGCAKPVYSSTEWPEITHTPIPMWSLINMNDYLLMNVQYSRGCPFDCEFCDIVLLNGHKPRTKTKEQLITELETLYARGWRDGVFIVDDNFIGNKRKLKEDILVAIIDWMKQKRYPFFLQTEASINLADDEELMNKMVEAGFNKIFIGIETPNEASLLECEKGQNTDRDLTDSIKRILNHGLEVMGGFIVGFDNDPSTIFQDQINFIQKNGIILAMVDLLNAPKGTRLFQRLQKENRLVKNFSGDFTDFSINFEPKMAIQTLTAGYNNILGTIYSPRYYYERIQTFLKEYKHPRINRPFIFHAYNVYGLFGTLWLLGIRDKKGRLHFWKLLFSNLFKRTESLTWIIGFALFGLHVRKVFDNHLNTEPVSR